MSGRSARACDAQVMCAHIRSLVRNRWGNSAADAVRIQYGGSVKGGRELMEQPDIDGALVNADEFTRIVNFRLYQRKCACYVSRRPTVEVVHGGADPNDPNTYRKMAYGKKADPGGGRRSVDDHTTIIYNEHITVTGIPSEAQRYQLD